VPRPDFVRKNDSAAKNDHSLEVYMSSVRNRSSHATYGRFLGAAVAAGALVFSAACQGGTDTPVAPSMIDVGVPTASSTAATVGADGAETHGGPLSFAMDEMAGSGYSGTCTLGNGGEGFRIKASGRGRPGTLIRFILRETATGGRYTTYTDVDERGAFRTGQDRITFFASGLDAECLLMGGDGTILARGATFQIP
jgi:hypothetical protein